MSYWFKGPQPLPSAISSFGQPPKLGSLWATVPLSSDCRWFSRPSFTSWKLLPVRYIAKTFTQHMDTYGMSLFFSVNLRVRFLTAWRTRLWFSSSWPWGGFQRCLTNHQFKQNIFLYIFVIWLSHLAKYHKIWVYYLFNIAWYCRISNDTKYLAGLPSMPCAFWFFIPNHWVHSLGSLHHLGAIVILSTTPAGKILNYNINQYDVTYSNPGLVASKLLPKSPCFSHITVQYIDLPVSAQTHPPRANALSSTAWCVQAPPRSVPQAGRNLPPWSPAWTLWSRL